MPFFYGTLVNLSSLLASLVFEASQAQEAPFALVMWDSAMVLCS